MGTYCTPLVADFFLFCYERDFIMSLYDDKQADIIDAKFNSTSRHLDDILKMTNVYFDNMVSQYTLKRFDFIKLTPLISKPCFWMCICPWLMILFLPKFTIRVTILIL